jgi:hypothetical protein
MITKWNQPALWFWIILDLNNTIYGETRCIIALGHIAWSHCLITLGELSFCWSRLIADASVAPSAQVKNNDHCEW